MLLLVTTLLTARRKQAALQVNVGTTRHQNELDVGEGEQVRTLTDDRLHLLDEALQRESLVSDHHGGHFDDLECLARHLS